MAARWRTLFKGSELDGWGFDFAKWAGVQLTAEDADAFDEHVRNRGLRWFLDDFPALCFVTTESEEDNGPGNNDTYFKVGTSDPKTAKRSMRLMIEGFLKELHPPDEDEDEDEDDDLEDAPARRMLRRVAKFTSEYNEFGSGSRIWMLVAAPGDPATDWTTAARTGSIAATWGGGALRRTTSASRFAELQAGDVAFCYQRTPAKVVVGLTTVLGPATDAGLPIGPVVPTDPLAFATMKIDALLAKSEPCRSRRGVVLRVSEEEARRLLALLVVQGQAPFDFPALPAVKAVAAAAPE